MVHPVIMQWINQAYPRPKIDPDWLNACYAWVLDEFKFDTATQMDDIKREVEVQLLESDLNDSTLEGTGVPRNILSLNDYRLRGSPVLVEITAFTEIGHSAFNLQNVRQNRLEKVDLNGLAGEGADDVNDDNDGPIPKYPRTMLRFELSDGTTVFPAIEYRPLKSLVLGETPLGYKMILKEGLVIRRGIAFLDPETVLLKGHKTEEREMKQDANFLRSLHKRLGKPETEETNAVTENEIIRAQPAARPVINYHQGILDRTGFVDGDDSLPRKRRNVDPSLSSTGTTLVASPYFSSHGNSAVSSSSSTRVDPISSYMSRVLSPSRGDDFSCMDAYPEGPPTSESGSSNLTNHKMATNRSVVKSQSTSDIDYDFDNDVDIDDAFLEEIAKVEESAIGNIESGPQGLATSLHNNPTSRSVNAEEVITIDDDGDEDKENLPNSLQVYNRTLTRSQLPPGIIDISDSD